jgi:NADH-quinone oxidoreductase subunit D
MTIRIQAQARRESLLLNMGPSHPAMHGTIRILLELEGERVREAEVEIGFLHRGFEKTCENRTWFNLLPFTDRLNYVSPLLNNLGYALAVERLLGVEAPPRAQLIRVLMGELSRIADHLTCIAAMAMESGAFTVFLYNIKAREFIWDVIEATTGARMMTSYIRIGGVRADLAPGWREALDRAVTETRQVLKDVAGLLDRNAIFLKRTRDVAVMSPERALAYGWTGPCLRSTGIAYDVRRAHPYQGYGDFEFEIPTGERGDNFDRYRVRMREMEQSLRIVEQAAGRLGGTPPELRSEGVDPADAIASSRSRRERRPLRLSPNLEGAEKSRSGDVLADGPWAVPPKDDVYTSIEGLIRHFQFFMKGYGIRPPRGEVYAAVEGGNGETGFYLVSDGSETPSRVHLRAPCFHLVAALGEMIRGLYLADIIPTFGSLNMIGGELDR